MKQVPPTNNKKAKIAAGKTQKSGQGYIFTTKQPNPDLANNQKVKVVAKETRYSDGN